MVTLNVWSRGCHEQKPLGYRFSVTSNRNNKMLGTGFFKSSRKMTRVEQLNFFHQYTHGMYQKEESFISIDIFEAEA